MTYTKQHAAENDEMYRAAIIALKKFGWTPRNEPHNWRTLVSIAQASMYKDFPGIPSDRIRHQVLRVVMEYRGKPEAWG